MSFNKIKPISSNLRLVDNIQLQTQSEVANQPFLAYHNFINQDLLSHFTFSDFDSITNQIGYNLKSKIGNYYELRYHSTSYSSFKTKGFSSIAFLGNSGMKFIMNLIALMKLNLTPLVLSPRNSLPILIELIREGNCKTLIYHKEMENTAKDCAKEINGLNLVEFENIFNLKIDKGIQLTPLLDLSAYQDDYSEHIVLIIHSSGSTATPKLNYLSNRYFATYINDRKTNNKNDYLGRGLICSPLFHLYGFFLFLNSLLNGSMIILKDGNLSAESIIKDIKNFGIDYFGSLPYLLKQIVDYSHDNPNIWDTLSQLKIILSAGASIPAKVGQTFKKHQIPIQSGFGSTEVGCLGYSNILNNDINGVNQFEFSNSIKYKLTDIEGDTCQITILKSDPGLATGIVKDDEEGYPVGDVFKIIHHNPDSNYIKLEIVSRANDTIIHLTGEKTNPLPIEHEICSSPYISKCLVYGRNKLNNCVLITLDPEQSLKIPFLKLMKEVFNQVEKANIQCPSHSRILKDLIYILPINSDKQFITTPKGNVMRHKTEILFKDEIESIYDAYENQSNENVSYSSDEGIEMIKYNNQIITSIIIDLFKKATNYHIKDENSSFFQSGLDSLSAVKYRHLIQSKFKKISLNLNMIYSYDTPLKLSQQILALNNGDHKSTKDLDYYQRLVDQLVDEYSIPFDETPSQRKEPNEKKNILITGANGSLSGFTIKALLERNDIGTIYCLVRGKSKEDSLNRLLSSFKERKIELNDLQMKQLIVLPYVTTSSTLGLEEADYQKIYNEIDIIYHVAWRMDFLKEVEAFRDCIESTRNLLKLSVLAPHRPHFNFISTIGATFPVIFDNVKEDSLGTKLINLTTCNGYNLSKLVSEAICERLSSKHLISLDILRVGQVSGDTINGVWNTKEHIPLIIKGAQIMKMLPSTLFKNISWIPVDYAGLAMVQIQFNPNNLHNFTVSHIVNPSLQSWSEVIEALRSTHIKFELVSNEIFIKELKENPKYNNAEINPLASLTEFFEELMKKNTKSIIMDTNKTCLLSNAIKECPKLDTELTKAYIKNWVDDGFLEA